MQQRLKQHITKSLPSQHKVLKFYYSLLFELNDISLRPKELDFLTYLAQRASHPTLHIRQEFAKEFQSSPAAINNMVSRLYKKKLLIKEGTWTRINPSIRLPKGVEGLDLHLTVNLTPSEE